MYNKNVSNMENVEMKALFSIDLPVASFALFSILNILIRYFHFYNLYLFSVIITI